MTYKDAKQIIDDNWAILSPRMVDSKPPHLVLRSLIAPEGSSLNTLVAIDAFIKEDHLPNDEVLLQMGLFANNLKPFIVYQMSGDVIIMALDSYTTSYLGNDLGNAV